MAFRAICIHCKKKKFFVKKRSITHKSPLVGRITSKGEFCYKCWREFSKLLNHS